ncbi:MAG: hypothetical protein AAB133_08325, partial [Pseudomonadota bacterium]
RNEDAFGQNPPQPGCNPSIVMSSPSDVNRPNRRGWVVAFVAAGFSPRDWYKKGNYSGHQKDGWRQQQVLQGGRAKLKRFRMSIEKNVK